MIYLNKLLPIFISPIGLISALILIGLMTRRHGFAWTGIILFWLASLPIISNSLIKSLESDYEIQNIDQIASHDAVVVLSGMISTIQTEKEIKYEFREGVDRILAGIALLKNQKANKLILTRGLLPWGTGSPEGEVLSDFAQANGVRKDEILLTSQVQNTNDEAKEIAKLVKSEDRIVLVTSAFHMPRALMVFQNQNILVTPFAVDFRHVSKKIDLLDFFPQAFAFEDTSLFFREMIGRAYYALKY